MLLLDGRMYNILVLPMMIIINSCSLVVATSRLPGTPPPTGLQQRSIVLNMIAIKVYHTGQEVQRSKI